MSASSKLLKASLAAALCALMAPSGALAKKKAAPPPPPPPPAEIPLAPLTPPIEAKTILASPVDAGPAAATPAAEVTAPIAPAEERAPFQLAPRVGLYLPRGALGLGPLVGAEVGWTLPISGVAEAIDQRFTLVLAASWVETGLAEPSLVQGRGYDAGFSQRSALVPMELGLRWRLPIDVPLELHVEAGFGLFATWTSFRSFSTTTEQSDLTPGFVGAAQAELPLGPGRAVLRVADFEASAELGPLGPGLQATGEPSFAGIAVALGYVVPLGL